MAAGYQELFLEQGSDFSTSITLDDVNGDPYDLTDYVAKSQVKKSYYSSNPTANFVITLRIDVDIGPRGVTKVIPYFSR